MSIRLLNIGFGNMVAVSRVIAMVSPESAPIKRIIQDVRERGDLIDATYGRRTRALQRDPCLVEDEGQRSGRSLPEVCRIRLRYGSFQKGI